MPILDNGFVPDTQRLVQGLTDRAVVNLAANPALARDLMSSGSYRHLVQGTRKGVRYLFGCLGD